MPCGTCGVLRGKWHGRNLSKRNHCMSPAKCSKPAIKRESEATCMQENEAEDRGPNRSGVTCAKSRGAALSSQRSTNPEFQARGNDFQDECTRTTSVALQISHQRPCLTRTVHSGRTVRSGHLDTNEKEQRAPQTQNTWERGKKPTFFSYLLISFMESC